MSKTMFYVLVNLLVLFPMVVSIEPITSGIGMLGAMLVSVSYAGWEYTKCKRQECCDDTWVKLNYSGLQSDLQRTLHGQHLVESIVARSIKGHVTRKNPKKALVMTFNGWTGTGKNFVSNIVADNLFINGKKSNFVHLYIATRHFPHESHVEEYKKYIQKEIQEHTKSCGRSLFVFDEMDKMPRGVVDAIKPFIDYHEKVDGIDYRRNIFIFLSNAGGKGIASVAYKFYLDGKDRESITMKDVEPIVNTDVYNEKGGLQFSDIVQKNLIDVFIPFLPLEKKHIKLCIRNELRERFLPVDDELVQRISNDLLYFPQDFPIYSSSGCKKVSQKVDVHTFD